MLLAFFCGMVCVGIVLIKVPASCENCPAIFWQMGLVLITRCLFIFLYSLYTNMAAECYPVKAMDLTITG